MRERRHSQRSGQAQKFRYSLKIESIKKEIIILLSFHREKRAQSDGRIVILSPKHRALEALHVHVDGDGRPEGEGGDGLGVTVGYVEGMGALEALHGHVDGNGRPQGGGRDGLGGEVGHVEGMEPLRHCMCM